MMETAKGDGSPTSKHFTHVSSHLSLLLQVGVNFQRKNDWKWGLFESMLFDGLTDVTELGQKCQDRIQKPPYFLQSSPELLT